MMKNIESKTESVDAYYFIIENGPDFMDFTNRPNKLQRLYDWTIFNGPSLLYRISLSVC